jgi:hypothetical protein
MDDGGTRGEGLCTSRGARTRTFGVPMACPLRIALNEYGPVVDGAAWRVDNVSADRRVA